MKTIEERAKEYIQPLPDIDAYFEDMVYSAFCDGAQSEHEELTRWNSPDVLPDEHMICLGKTKYYDDESYELLVYHPEEKMFINCTTRLRIVSPELIGWRRIHE